MVLLVSTCIPWNLPKLDHASGLATLLSIFLPQVQLTLKLQSLDFASASASAAPISDVDMRQPLALAQNLCLVLLFLLSAACGKGPADQLRTCINSNQGTAHWTSWASAIHDERSRFKVQGMWWSDQQRSNSQLTLLTHLTLDQKWQLKALCKSWPGPLSIVIHVPTVKPGAESSQSAANSMAATTGGTVANGAAAAQGAVAGNATVLTAERAAVTTNGSTSEAQGTGAAANSAQQGSQSIAAGGAARMLLARRMRRLVDQAGTPAVNTQHLEADGTQRRVGDSGSGSKGASDSAGSRREMAGEEDEEDSYGSEAIMGGPGGGHGRNNGQAGGSGGGDDSSGGGDHSAGDELDDDIDDDVQGGAATVRPVIDACIKVQAMHQSLERLDACQVGMARSWGRECRRLVQGRAAGQGGRISRCQLGEG